MRVKAVSVFVYFIAIFRPIPLIAQPFFLFASACTPRIVKLFYDAHILKNRILRVPEYFYEKD